MQNQPTGFCQCGCGQRTQICARTFAAQGLYAGQPLRYVRGHWTRRDCHQACTPDTCLCRPCNCASCQAAASAKVLDVAWTAGTISVDPNRFQRTLFPRVPERKFR